MSTNDDREVIRDLAEQYVEVCRRPAQKELRDLWRRHNSLKKTRPLVIIMGGKAFQHEVADTYQRLCEDPLLRGIEGQLRMSLFEAGLDDDNIFEPWLKLGAAHTCGGWGIDGERRYAGDDLTSWKCDYPLKKPEDLDKLREPWHGIDEAKTKENVERVQEAIGDILPISVDRGSAYRSFGGDLSTAMHYLRGIENFMMDMADNPEWLHRLVSFMSDGVLKAHDEAEEAGDWCGDSHNNQSMPYAEELPDPAPNVRNMKRSQLWCYFAAQEFAGIGPKQHEEFLLRYQMPIMKKFGLVSYGCCEDLTNKIAMLRQIPNLRRIAVTPWADVARCAEQIGTDYVMSWRPSPTNMVCTEFSPQRIRDTTRGTFEACRGLHIDVTLKDIQTVQNEPERLRQWVQITKEVAAEF